MKEERTIGKYFFIIGKRRSDCGFHDKVRDGVSPGSNVSRGVSSQVYLQQDKKKAEAESGNCHAQTMLSLEKPIKLI